MVKFDYRGVRIEATVEMKRSDYKDANNVGSTRYDRNVFVVVQFWNFVICNDLYELAMVKSTLNYFKQAYWKRSTKQGAKIELATSLEHNDTVQKLKFIAKQKNNIYSLEVSLTGNGQQLESIYLSGQEVIMLDIAISKAISLLTPEALYS